MHPTFHSNSSSLANALGGMQPARETRFALPPTNPSANSVHYPHYPTERAFSRTHGGPALAHPTQPPTPQMPTPPQNHPFSQFTPQNNQGLDIQYQHSLPQPHAGNDQHARLAQYQPTFPAGVYPSAPNTPRLHSDYSFSHLQPMLQGGLPAAQLQVQRTHSLPAQSIVSGLITNGNIHPVTRQTHATAASHPSLSTTNATSRTPSQLPHLVNERPISGSQLQRSAAAPKTSSRSLSRPSTFNRTPHQHIAANPTPGRASQSTGPTFRPPAPPARQAGPYTSSVPVHPPRQFAAPHAPTPVQRTQSLPVQPPQMRPVAARAPVGPSPLQQSMTTPANLAGNPYAYMLSKPSQPATSNAQQVNVPPAPQLRRSATEPTTGKRRYDEEKVEEEKRQAKKAKVVSESEMTPKVPQTVSNSVLDSPLDMKEDGIWPCGCPTYYPVPLADEQPVGGKGRRALSADDPSPVSSSMETAHESDEVEEEGNEDASDFSEDEEETTLIVPQGEHKEADATKAAGVQEEDWDELFDELINPDALA
ncbi:hypothetical protein BDZ89DRAFT_1148118 [Hymenopellis radicata]|nr:hypothetical protein BDZ89DRAFT_1148118 [Hymenopellis radicata]